MKRALMYASVASMIQQFNMHNIKLLIELGYTVDVACNFELGSTISKGKVDKLKLDLKEMGVNFYQIPLPRKILNINKLYISYMMTKKLINDNKYSLIHCHSPVGGVIARLANKNSKNYNNSHLIYTAHGFHFFKGNNQLKNFLFRNIEKKCAQYTDVLITINKEDYNAAKCFRLRKNGRIEYVPGVGIDTDKINLVQKNRNTLMKELHISDNSYLMVSVGELSKRKNHEIIIKIMDFLPKNVHYLICGQGDLYSHLLELTKGKNIDDRVHLLGYRSNIIEIVKSCDVFVFPSFQEGLPVALMEALACGVPCVASNIRGNCDLIDNEINGHLVDVNNIDEWHKGIEKFLKVNFEERKVQDERMKKYDIKFIEEQMRNLYLGAEING